MASISTVNGSAGSHDGLVVAQLQPQSNDTLHYPSTDEGTSEDVTNPRLVNGVIVLLLLVLNIIGNSLVCFIYRCRIKPSVFAFFVTILATLDLCTAMTTMVIDIILKMRPESEDKLNILVMCKLSHFEAYGSSLLGGSVFVLIAYQRYRKICHPLKPSLTIRKARLYVLAIAICCLVLATPTLLINGPAQISVLASSGDHVVNTTICRYDERYKGTVVQVSFSYLLLSAFSLMITTTVTFYILIFRALRTFERTSSVYGAGLPSSPATPLPEIGEELQEQNGWKIKFSRLSLTQGQGHNPSPNNANNQPHQPRANSMAALARRRASGRSFSTITMTEGGGERVSSQMHRVFTVVTGVFVVSYLPHLIVLVLNAVLALDARTLTWTQRFLLELAYNCPYISTVANPFVYGFRSAEFRKHCKKLLSCSGGKRKSRRGRGRR